MAVTLYPPYSSFPSLHEELYHVAVSDNAASTNFKYVFDIKINNVLVSRLKVFPDPATNKGICNVGGVVRNYWASYFKPSTGGGFREYAGTDNKVTYTLEVGEDINGSVTTNLASGTFDAYNFVSYLFTDPAANSYSTLTGTYGTKRDLTQLTYNGTERLFISFLLTAPTTYAVTFNNGLSDVILTGQAFSTFTLLNLSPAAINAALAQNFITDSTQQWTVTINNKTVIVKRACDQHKKVILNFLNQSGGYDTAAFRLVNRETRNIERKTFKQKDQILIDNYMRPQNTNNIFVGGNVQFGTIQQVGYTLNSDYVNQQDYNWFKELIASPEVYLQYQAGTNTYYYPVTIKDNNWTEKFRRSDKLFNMTLNIDVLETNSQYR